MGGLPGTGRSGQSSGNVGGMPDPDHVIEGLDYEPDITGEPTGGFELPYNDLYDEDGDLVDWEPDPGPGD